MFKHNAIAFISGALALLFTVYIALDTFVISHVYAAAVPAASPSGTYSEASQSVSSVSQAADSQSTSSAAVTAESTDESQSEAAAVVTESSYSDDNIRITITTYRENDTDIHVADIQLSSPEYLKTALAKASYGKNVVDTTSDIAAQNNAILAINGDYYGVQETGYVIRNGVLYRSASRGDQEDLAIYADGTMAIINEQDVTAEELLQQGVYNLLCFGPGLVIDGEISVSATDEVDKAMTSNPRTAIGILDSLHYVFVVADGRTSANEGLSLYQLAQFMQGLGVTTAYNLDGGGSSTLYFNGEVLNQPTSGTGKKGHSASTSGTSERSVSDIVYIGY